MLINMLIPKYKLKLFQAKETIFLLPLPIDIKEKIFNIYLEDFYKYYNLIPFNLRFLNERDFIEIKVDYKKINEYLVLL